MSIAFTDRAARHVKKYLAKRENGKGLRFSVQTTGCSGYAYRLEYVDEVPPSVQLPIDGVSRHVVSADHVIVSNGISVFVDEKSLSLLVGTEVDYVREGLKEGFIFKNPNVKNTCGCGESFRV